MLIFNPKTVRCSLPILLIFSSIILFAWTPPVNISNSEGGSKFSAICQDGKGWLHVVWEDEIPGNYDIYYNFYNGNTWADTLNVSDDTTTSWEPDVVADTLNRVHVVWGDYYTGEIMWSVKDSNSWSTPVPISDTAPFSVAPEIDVSPVTNYVHCAWHNLGDAEIWYSYYDGSSWSVPENVTKDSNDDAWADVAVDSLNRVHLVWMDYASYDIFYSRKDSVSWSPFVNISNLTGQSSYPRIAIDNENNPGVVWEEYGVYYTYYDGSGWVNPVLVDVDYSGNPDIAFDGKNKAHIVYDHEENNVDIFYTMYVDTLQQIPPENISNSDSNSLCPAVSVDSLHVHALWTQVVGNRSEIYYSRRENSGIENKRKMITSFSIPFIVIKKLTLSYHLESSSNVKVIFYDITGRKIKEKKLGYKNKGNYQFDLTLNLSSGMYFCILRTDNQKYRGKFILINP